MTNTEILCYVIGWQGGTVHQIAKTIGATVSDIIGATDQRMHELCRVAQQARIQLSMKFRQLETSNVEENKMVSAET